MGNSSLNKASRALIYVTVTGFGVMSLSAVSAPVYAATNSAAFKEVDSVVGLNSHMSLSKVQLAATSSTAPTRSSSTTSHHEGFFGSLVHSIGSAVGGIAIGISHVVQGIGSGLGHVANGIIQGFGKGAAGLGKELGGIASGIGKVVGGVATGFATAGSGIGTIVGGIASGIGGVVGGLAAGVGSVVGGIAGGIGHTIINAVSSLPTVAFHIPSIVWGAVTGGVGALVSEFIPTSGTDFGGLIPPIVRNAEAGMNLVGNVVSIINAIPTIGYSITNIAKFVFGILIGAGLPLITGPITGAIHGAEVAIHSAIVGPHSSATPKTIKDTIVPPASELTAVSPAIENSVPAEVHKAITNTPVIAPNVALLG